MQSIDRAMKIIHFLISGDINKYYTISELSKACDIPLSSMHRILSSMNEHGMINRDRNKKLYGLGSIWLEYGLKAYDTLDYVSMIRPELESLMKTVNASVYLTKRIEKESMIIERIDSLQQNVRVNEQLGLRLPLYKGTTNRVILANLDEHTLQTIIEDHVQNEERDSLLHQLQEIKIAGYIKQTEAHLGGITIIAAPILNRINDVEGSISVRIVNYELEDNKIEQVIQNVIHTAQNISQKMGYTHVN